MQTLTLKRQLAFVDDQAGVIAALGNRGEDAVKWNHKETIITLRAESIGQQQSQSQIGSGQSAWNSDRGSPQVRDREWVLGHDHGTIFVAHAAAAGQERAFVEEISVGMNADGGYVQ